MLALFTNPDFSTAVARRDDRLCRLLGVRQAERVWHCGLGAVRRHPAARPDQLHERALLHAGFHHKGASLVVRPLYSPSRCLPWQARRLTNDQLTQS